MASELEGNYFVRLDAPPPPSRYAPRDRDQGWVPQPPTPVRRRRRRIHVRPGGVVLLAILAWVGWAYTTPGGPSARIQGWIDHTRGAVEDASANPDLHQAASYFNGLYVQQGAYPDLSDTAIREDPNAGFGISMTFVWCSGHDVVLQSLTSGGTVSRLLLNGKDLGNVPSAQSCPVSLKHPAPWKAN